MDELNHTNLVKRLAMSTTILTVSMIDELNHMYLGRRLVISTTMLMVSTVKNGSVHDRKLVTLIGYCLVHDWDWMMDELIHNGESARYCWR